MGLGAALQQLGGMYLQRNFQRQDDARQQQIDAKRRAEDEALWRDRQAYLARLNPPQERVRQVYDEQRRNALAVREQWQPGSDASQGPPSEGRWVETGRDALPPKDKQPQVITGWKGGQQVTGVIDPDDPSSFKELFSGAPPKSQVVGGGSGSGRGKAPSGFRYTDDGDLEAIPGGPADLKQKAADDKATTFSSSDKKNIASLRQSLGNLDAIEAQLAKVEEAYAPLKGTISAGGFGQGMIPTESGKRFDAAVGQLAPLMRQLTRVPGEGAMSDYETKLMERANLNRGDYESTTAEKMTNLRQLVSEAKQARLSALDVYGLDANGEPKAKKEPNAAPQGQAGATRNNPVQISSEAEADALPPGTWVMLNGRLGQT